MMMHSPLPRKHHPFTIRLFSFLLVFLLLFASMPPVSFAAGPDSTAENEIGNETETALLYTELVDKRETFVKHFSRSDGQYVAIVYTEAVHKEKNGVMVDLDNRFSYDAVKVSYQTANEDFRVCMAASASADKLVSVSFEGYTLSWSVSAVPMTLPPLSGAGNTLTAETASQTDFFSMARESASASSLAVLTQTDFVDPTAKTTFSREEIGTSFTSTAALSYPNAFTGSGKVDLVYTVSENRLEEDILIKEKGILGAYVLDMTAVGLRAALLEDNRLTFTAEDGSLLFTIGAPWMSDAAGEISDHIEVQLVQKGDRVTVIYVPDAAWLNDPARVYPVLIDPSVRSRNYTANYEDTYVESGSTANNSTRTVTRVGVLTSGKEYESYTRILNYPTLPDHAVLTQATMTFYSTYSTGGHRMKRLNTNWSISDLVFNESRPMGVGAEYAATITALGNNYYAHTFDFTNELKPYSGSASRLNSFLETGVRGFRLYGATKPVSSSTLAVFLSAESTVTTYRPTLELTYNYLQYLPIKGGGVYSLKNKNSGKYLTAVSTSTNVYQFTRTGTAVQAFTFVGSNGVFSIQSVNRSGEALTWDYTRNAVQTDGNVYTSAYSADSADQQEFLVQYVTSANNYDYFALLSRADSSYALTTYGTLDGMTSGTTTTSRGNAYMAPYTGASSQLWIFESGGLPVFVGEDITALNGQTREFVMGSKMAQPFACVTKFGDALAWSSDHPSVTFDSEGRISLKGCGKATISAQINRVTVYSFTILTVLEDGVYYVQNKSSGLYLDAAGNGLANGTLIKQSAKAAIPSNPDPKPTDTWLGELWRICHLGNGYYSLRPLRKMDMTLNNSLDKVFLYNMGTTDTQEGVLDPSEWYLDGSGQNNLQFKAKLNSRCLTYNEDSIRVAIENTSDTKQWWSLTPISVTPGIVVYNYVDGIALEDSVQFIAAPYSNNNLDQTVTWSSSDETVLSIDDSGVAKSLKAGIAEITVTQNTIKKSFHVMSNFSASLNSTILPDSFYNSLNQPYNVWPASAQSRYMDVSDADRIEELNSIKNKAELLETGAWIVYNVASDMIGHFLTNTGELYTIDFKEMLYDNADVENNRAVDLNEIMRVIETRAETATQGSIKTMSANSHTVSGTSDWYYAINKYYTSVDAIYTKSSNGIYTATVTYRLYDVYDFGRTDEEKIAFLVSPSDMWELHHGGLSKNYEVFGINQFTISWTEGQTIDNGAVIHAET